MRGDNLPIVDLSKFNTERKEAHDMQIDHIVGTDTASKKTSEEHIKKAQFEFMMDSKTNLVNANRPDLAIVSNSMRP